MKTRNEQDWRTTLPEEWTVTVTDPEKGEIEIPLREHPALAKYATKDEAVKALVHAQRMLGRRPEGYLPLPEDHAPERMAEIYATLGRPDSPDGYAMPDMDLPEDFKMDADFLNEFRAHAHELGLTADQVAGLYTWFLPVAVRAMESKRQATETARGRELDALRSVHRGATRDVLTRALQCVRALGGDELLDALDATGAGDRAAVISAFARMAPLLLENGLRGEGMDQGPDLTREKLVEMMRDPRYSDPLKRDSAYVKKIRNGFKQLYPGDYVPGTRV